MKITAHTVKIEPDDVLTDYDAFMAWKALRRRQRKMERRCRRRHKDAAVTVERLLDAAADAIIRIVTQDR